MKTSIALPHKPSWIRVYEISGTNTSTCASEFLSRVFYRTKSPVTAGTAVGRRHLAHRQAYSCGMRRGSLLAFLLSLLTFTLWDFALVCIATRACFFFCERRMYDRSPVVDTIHVTLLVGQRIGLEVWVTSGPMRKRSPTGVQIT